MTQTVSRAKKRSMWWWVGYALAIIWTLIVIFPIISMTLLGFRSTADIYADPTGFTGGWQPENFLEAWAGSTGATGMGVYLTNSLLAAVAAIVVAVGFGAIAAYGIVRIGGRIRLWVLRMLIAAISMPIVIIMIPLFGIFDSAGMLNNPIALGIAYGTLNLPLAVMILHAAFLDFPTELIEASKLDGLNEFRAFLQIVVPLTKGSLMSVAILVLIFAWGEAQLGVVTLLTPDSRTLAVGLLGFEGQYFSNQGVMFAGLALATVPVVLAYLALQKYVVKGVSFSGASK